jgi:hypothetical protein|tara:strand:- start:265 stop:483 length:219 start_codon:yes stop_codon:yes gene_type:complete
MLIVEEAGCTAKSDGAVIGSQFLWFFARRQCQRNFLAGCVCAAQHHQMIKPKPFNYFKTLPEIIRLAVMIYV